MTDPIGFYEEINEPLFWFEKIADGFHDFGINCFKKNSLT